MLCTKTDGETLRFFTSIYLVLMSCWPIFIKRTLFDSQDIFAIRYGTCTTFKFEYGLSTTAKETPSSIDGGTPPRQAGRGDGPIGATNQSTTLYLPSSVT